MNVNLLRATRDWVLKEPNMMNMREGICRLSTARRDHEHAGLPECGTVGCIAGTGVMIHMRLIGKTFDEVQKAMGSSHWFGFVEVKAIEAFQLDDRTSRRLFYVVEWPHEFRTRLYQHKPGTREYASIVAERIDYFIETNGY